MADRKLSVYSEARLPTAFGTLRVRLYRDADGAEPMAILGSGPIAAEHTPVRIHSACFTSESLGSLKCDCREQLNFALQFVARHGGVVVYLHQEGRGIGLGEKLRAYALQEQGYDTVEANHSLGFPADARDYEAASLILKDLGIQSVRLMTNNPDKISGLRKNGIRVVERIPIVVEPTQHSAQYLATKYTRMGHMGSEDNGVHPIGEADGILISPSESAISATNGAD
jgi:GTP cyclohydrolase II